MGLKLLKMMIKTILFICLFLFQMPVFAESIADSQQAKNIKRALEHQNYKAISNYLQQHHNIKIKDPTVLYQLARYHLIKNVKEDSSIIGYSYPQVDVENAILSLNKAIEIKPNYFKSYSLLGHIYAIQNQQQKAQMALTKASKDPQLIWQNYNLAVLAIQKKQYKKAAQLLTKLTRQHPPKKQHKAKMYAASWQLLKRIAIKYPKLDPVKMIRQGLVQRIQADAFLTRLKALKTEDKPSFIVFSSSDSWCSFCLKGNAKIAYFAQRYNKKFNFFYISFEPWIQFQQYPDITKKVGLKGVPAQAIFTADKMQAIYYGKTLNKRIMKALTSESIYNKIKTGALAEQLNSRELKKLEKKLDADVKKYQIKSGEKAYALAFNGRGNFVSRYRYKIANLKQAKKESLALCEKIRKKRKYSHPCKIYFENNKRVLPFNYQQMIYMLGSPLTL